MNSHPQFVTRMGLARPIAMPQMCFSGDEYTKALSGRSEGAVFDDIIRGSHLSPSLAHPSCKGMDPSPLGYFDSSSNIGAGTDWRCA